MGSNQSETFGFQMCMKKFSDRFACKPVQPQQLTYIRRKTKWSGRGSLKTTRSLIPLEMAICLKQEPDLGKNSKNTPYFCKKNIPIFLTRRLVENNCGHDGTAVQFTVQNCVSKSCTVFAIS
jgi:hypothetical protein